MIKVRLSGGLGNQMFQYALGRNLAIRQNTRLILDISPYACGGGITQRQFQLQAFNIQAEIILNQAVRATPTLIRKIKDKMAPYYQRSTINEQDFSFDENILKVGRDVVLQGYWQSEKYFIDNASQVREDFSFKYPLKKENRKLAEQIRSSLSVSLHVRRGDYVEHSEVQKIHGSCGFDYYTKAVELLGKRLGECKLFIFSDDLAWARDHLQFDLPIQYVDNQDNAIADLHLMSLCNHHIIANSTFSWWGAWLNRNPDKVVIAPAQWFATNKRDATDIIPNSWIKL